MELVVKWVSLTRNILLSSWFWILTTIPYVHALVPMQLAFDCFYRSTFDKGLFYHTNLWNLF